MTVLGVFLLVLGVLFLIAAVFILAVTLGDMLAQKAIKKYDQPYNPMAAPKKEAILPTDTSTDDQVQTIEPGDINDFISTAALKTPPGIVQILSHDDKMKYQFAVPAGFRIDQWIIKQHEENMPSAMRLQMVFYYGTRVLMVTVLDTLKEPMIKYILAYGDKSFSELRRIHNEKLKLRSGNESNPQ